ncbi:MAG TPA: 3-hydroxyacyl-[acyl-carrier-protein] dehydratase FabA [Kiritimatiellia bacterium]|nr:3-hydroxyacyl-[acyl-carrier-protein] dehydratase FabA [Kiritimatiellia bacterium]HMP35777.1 3-hydroxyacyl-[acyl-carrier-protein] dehydratase FabA [Kiritimatiellia bacterium]
MTRKNAYSYDELLAAGRGELFGPESARLPLPNMLMFDRINEITEGAGAYQSGIVRAELDIKPELWFFGCHFQGDPVMPGCLGLDSLWQLTGFFLAWSGHKGKGRALGVGEVKFTGQILPTSKVVSYTIDIKRVINRKLVLAIADGKVAVDGKEVYTADSLKVGLFESTDGF